MMMNSSSGSNSKTKTIIMARIMDIMIITNIKMINLIINTITQAMFHKIANSLNPKLNKLILNQIFLAIHQNMTQNKKSLQLSNQLKNLFNQTFQMNTKKIINFNLMKISFLKCLRKKILNKNHLIILNQYQRNKMNNSQTYFSINSNHRKINNL